jgi:hypothetical protein
MSLTEVAFSGIGVAFVILCISAYRDAKAQKDSFIENEKELHIKHLAKANGKKVAHG